MRTDPAETGGLFVGRRPGTAPIHYREPPARGSEARQRIDDLLAALILAAITLGCLLCWGPIPLACLWIGSRVNYSTGSASLGIVASFACLFALLFGALAVVFRLDRAWILVRRAAGHDQRKGACTRVLAITVAIIGIAFTFWFFVIHGPASPGHPNLEYHG